MCVWLGGWALGGAASTQKVNKKKRSDWEMNWYDEKHLGMISVYGWVDTK